jgi:divalent metal cation (Fe/Co/Zn/Cd) transporter
MPILSTAQRDAGRKLGAASAVADSKQTLLCAYLSGVLLVNTLFGWSWADPIVALVIAAVAMKERRQAWRGPSSPLLAPGLKKRERGAPAGGFLQLGLRVLAQPLQVACVHE